MKKKILIFRNINTISEINRYGLSWLWGGVIESPSEMLLVAAYLRNKGFDVDCRDVDCEQDISLRPYDIAVYWVSAQGVGRFIPLLQKIKKSNPACKIAVVVNDAYEDFEKELCEKYAHVDYIVRRFNRELTIEELLHKDFNATSISSGIIYRNEQGVVRDAGMRELSSLDHLCSYASILRNMPLRRYNNYFIVVIYVGRCFFSVPKFNPRIKKVHLIFRKCIPQILGYLA